MDFEDRAGWAFFGIVFLLGWYFFYGGKGYLSEHVFHRQKIVIEQPYRQNFNTRSTYYQNSLLEEQLEQERLQNQLLRNQQSRYDLQKELDRIPPLNDYNRSLNCTTSEDYFGNYHTRCY